MIKKYLLSIVIFGLLNIYSFPAKAGFQVGKDEEKELYFSLNLELSVDGKIISAPNTILPLGDSGTYIIENEKTYKVNVQFPSDYQSEAKRLFGSNVQLKDNEYIIKTNVSILDAFAAEEQWHNLMSPNLIVELDKPSAMTANVFLTESSASTEQPADTMTLRATLHRVNDSKKIHELRTMKASKCEKLSDGKVSSPIINSLSARDCCTAGSVKCCFGRGCCSDGTTGFGCCI